MESVSVDVKHKPTGTIRVKLSEKPKADLDDWDIIMDAVRLGASHSQRFESLGNLSDLDDAISNKAFAVELVDEGHWNKSVRLVSLGKAQLRRFECLLNFADLEDAIINFDKAVHITEDGHRDKPTYLWNLVRARWCVSKTLMK